MQTFVVKPFVSFSVPFITRWNSFLFMRYDYSEIRQYMERQSPENDCYCLYTECSKAQSDKERIAYNRLIGVLRLLAEMY